MEDLRGNPISTASTEAAEHAEKALWRMVSFFGDPTADFEAACACGPAWALPAVMQADFILTLTEPALLPDAQRALALAQSLADTANDRERAHLAAMQRGLSGHWGEACALWDDILLQHPRDLLALICAHLFDFYRGDARNLRLRVARVLPQWRRDDPLFPYVLGMYAFGLEESNLYPQAEMAGREAVDSGAKVPWAIHAVAHVMEMQGRHAEGLRWLRKRHDDWADDNGLAVHNWWHLALFHLETLDHAGAFELYDDYIGVESASFNLQRLDAAALLWRLQLHGATVGARWRTLLNAWAGAEASVNHYAFNDLHVLLALLGAGELARAQAFLSAVEQRAESSDGDNRRMALEVAVPLMRGLLAFARDDHAQAVRHIAPVRDIAHHFGGSHAQRDLIDQTLLAASARGGSAALGRALLNERRLVKPDTPLTAYWEGRLGLRGASTAG